MVLCRWWCVDVQKGMMIEQEPLKLPIITVLNRRRTSADLSAGAPCAAPATQNETEVLQVLRVPREKETEVLQVLRLPRKMRLRCSKCCACHANAAGVHSNYSILAGLPRTSLEVLHVLHLPQKMRLRCSKCCACHANAAGGLSNYSILAGLPRTSLEVLHVLHLPRKMRLRCSKCCACHAKWNWGALSAAPATQTQPASTVFNRADFPGPLCW